MFRKKSENKLNKRQKSEGLTPRAKNYSYYESNTNRDKAPSTTRSVQRQLNKPAPVKGYRPWYVKVINGALVIAILMMIGYDLTLSSTPKVIIIGDDNTTNLFSISKQNYQQVANALFRQSFIQLNKVTLDTTSLAGRFEKQFPGLASVSISIPLIGRQPSVVVVPAKPALILNTNNKLESFLVASSGRVLAESPSGWPANTLPKVTDADNLLYQIGEAALDPSDINFIQTIVSQFKSKGLSITTMNLPAASRELDVSVVAEPYFIKFNLNDSADELQQIGTYFATKQYLATKNITPSQYIDVRVVGRVFYK